MRKIFILFLAFAFQKDYSQELFVVSDPASNVPANTLSVRLSQSLFKEEFVSGYNYHLMPELTYGLNKNGTLCRDYRLQLPIGYYDYSQKQKL